MGYLEGKKEKKVAFCCLLPSCLASSPCFVHLLLKNIITSLYLDIINFNFGDRDGIGYKEDTLQCKCHHPVQMDKGYQVTIPHQYCCGIKKGLSFIFQACNILLDLEKSSFEIYSQITMYCK